MTAPNFNGPSERGVVIDFASKRAGRAGARASSPEYLLAVACELVDRIATDRPDLSHEACCSIAKKVLARSISIEDACRSAAAASKTATPLMLPPDHPIFGLFDAYKEARRKYQDAIADVAKHSGRNLRSVASLMKSERRRGLGK